jgi:carbamoyl-phosphate synthase small subunit
MSAPNTAYLALEDGTVFPGRLFGGAKPASGEVVFNTGMVGYTETLTDPSYKGQILTLAYPLIGNYGVPDMAPRIDPHIEDGAMPPPAFESGRVHVSGLIVARTSEEHSHRTAARSFEQWLRDENIPALMDIDTRSLIKRLRTHGTMRGKIVMAGEEVGPAAEPDQDHLVPLVSVREPVVYPGSATRVVLVDCGCKAGILRSLLARGVTVIRVPWNYDFLAEDFDGVLVSNGPGDPQMCGPTVDHLRTVIEQERPVFGICLGHQLLALAAGATTYKLKFGHRSQNQPCIESGTKRCYITSQNHGYAVDAGTLPAGWVPWFTNANDGTNEGVRHSTLPFMSVQFHPEAAPGPVDTRHLFDQFLRLLR